MPLHEPKRDSRRLAPIPNSMVMTSLWTENFSLALLMTTIFRNILFGVNNSHSCGARLAWIVMVAFENHVLCHSCISHADVSVYFCGTHGDIVVTNK